MLTREFVEGKKALFYQSLHNFLFVFNDLTADHWFAGKKILFIALRKKVTFYRTLHSAIKG